jgi:hypothetical protein
MVLKERKKEYKSIGIELLLPTSTSITKTVPEFPPVHAQQVFEHQQSIRSWHIQYGHQFP